MTKAALSHSDYVALADFRYTLRQFMAFSEAKAREQGLTAQQHQALLAIFAAQPDQVTIGYLAERLLLKPHSASGLVDRLEILGLVQKQPSDADRRQALLILTEKAQNVLKTLSLAHREEIQKMKPLLQAILDGLDTR